MTDDLPGAGEPGGGEAVNVTPAPTVEDSLAVMAVKTLAGDVRDFLLDRLKHDHSPLPWDMRGEDEQQRTIDQADTAAEALIEKVFGLVQSQGRPAIVGKLKEIKKKDGIEAKVTFDSLAPLRAALLDATGKEVLVVLGESDGLMGDRGKPKPKDPRQREMFDGEGGPDGGPDEGDDGPVFDNTPSGKRD